MDWADKYRTLKIRTNADTPDDAKRARDFGAEGIGLCRTEHMFFDPRAHSSGMREMILAKDQRERRKTALKNLLPYQRKDFIGIFKAMKGLPVTIRLLDPPLHEFLPHDDEGSQAELAKALGMSLQQVKQRVDQLHETNPMLGHRGDRLAVTYPEILEMQVTRDHRGRDRVQEARISMLAGDHDPAGRHGEGTGVSASKFTVDDRRRAGEEEDKGKLGITCRHDDRSAAGRARRPTRSARSPSSSASARTI